MTADTLPGLLSKLSASLESASSSVPDTAAILPPQDGISLLDVKTELFLSYLQNLVFLILIKVRNQSEKLRLVDGHTNTHATTLGEDVVKKLVELRIYLEKGVRPLEGRLKYQLDKVLKAADIAAREHAQKSGSHSKATDIVAKRTKGEVSPDEAEHSSDGAASEEIDELSYRPNPAAFVRPANPKAGASASKSNGVYRPPRITPMAPPTLDRREGRDARKPLRSATVDEFISTELSTAPVAEHSIGSNIISAGRKSKSARERETDAERTAYEEQYLMRLPPESRKEKRKKGSNRNSFYGSEEIMGLTEGVDRVNRALSGRQHASGSTRVGKATQRMVQDGPRGSGFADEAGLGKRRKLKR